MIFKVNVETFSTITVEANSKEALIEMIEKGALWNLSENKRLQQVQGALF